MLDTTSILKIFLPSWLFDYFDVVKFCDSERRIDVYLDEKKIPPADYAAELLGSQGFTPSYTVQDFPVRGKVVYLHLRRRKWLLIKTGKIISNKFEFAYDGTRLTKEFVAFLKKRIETEATSISLIASHYNVDGKHLSFQYKECISDYRQWKQRAHASEYVLYKENLDEYLSIDETCLSNGELYTILTNKAARGGKGTLVAMVEGTKAETVINALCKMPRNKRLKVKEITLDLSPSMRLIAKRCFPNATIVNDRFHVQRLMGDAISDLRVSHRWEAIDLENAEIELAKQMGRRYIPTLFENGDTRRQLLARSRHVILKHQSKWTLTQKHRAEILFREYPDLQEAYQISMELTAIYNQRISPNFALTKLAHWYEKVEKLNLKYFKSVIETMQNNYMTIANYFLRRATNASAESFNAKVKAFRAQFRGVRDIPFFIYRLAKIFA